MDDASKYKKSNHIAIIIFTLIGLNYLHTQAQTPIQLKTALDSALQNSKTLQALKLEGEYFQKLKKTVAADLSKTAINFNYGHINSKAMDNKIDLTQTFDFPAVYKAKKAVFDSEIQKSKANLSLNAQQIRTQIRQYFYEYQVLILKQKLLVQADSLFANFKLKAQKRLNAGESNALKITNADNQLSQIQLQEMALQKQIKQTVHQFQYLIQTQQPYIPAITNPKIIELNNRLSTDNHASMQGFQAQYEKIKAQKKVNQNLVFPELVVGANSQTFVGYQQVGQQDVYFNSNTRFLSVNVGLNFKLFGLGAQKRKNQSFDVLMQQNNLASEAQPLHLQNELFYWNQELQNAKVVLATYEKSLLQNAQKTIQLANQKLQLGDINYLSWLLLVQQNIQIQNNYYDILSQYNQSVIQLTIFSNNP